MFGSLLCSVCLDFHLRTYLLSPALWSYKSPRGKIEFLSDDCHKVVRDLVSTAENTVCRNFHLSLEMFSSILKKYHTCARLLRFFPPSPSIFAPAGHSYNACVLQTSGKPLLASYLGLHQMDRHATRSISRVGPQASTGKEITMSSFLV